MKKKSSKESWVNVLCDYLPLAVFFITYKFYPDPNPLIAATVGLMVTTLIVLIISYTLTKKIAKMALFSGVILGFFGMATIILKDDTFIKMKPTIINLLFSAILFYCYFLKRPWLQNLLGSQVHMSNKAWLILSLRWACFFFCLAFLNEVIWRSYSTDFWVKFKVFGMMPISIIFTATQLPFMMREIRNFAAKDRI